MSWTKQEMDKVYQEIMNKAMSDEGFRKELLADPNAAISKATGKDIPADYKIRVIEEDPSYQATFMLPAFSGEELSEDELSKMAGGGCVLFGCGIDACENQVDK